MSLWRVKTPSASPLSTQRMPDQTRIAQQAALTMFLVPRKRSAVFTQLRRKMSIAPSKRLVLHCVTLPGAISLAQTEAAS